MRVVISSGHGKYISGAVGPEPWGLHEHTEAVKVVNKVAEFLRAAGVGVDTYEDTVSKSQNENLHRIVDFHNSKTRDLDVSVHFNCNVPTDSPVGCEVLYVSQSGFEVADEVVDEICINSGLKNRGAKKRSDLYFLNNTEETAVLIETCFVDSRGDVDIYSQRFDAICEAIAQALAGEGGGIEPEPPDEGGLPVRFEGTCSWFGGPDDTGVSPSEGLAFIYSYDQRPDLFLPQQPAGTTGLARRLDPEVFYVACRWDYDITPKDMLADKSYVALVRAGDREALAWPADWGPNEAETGRAADLSPGLMEALGLDTDDDVEVIYPAPEQPEPEQARVDIQITASGPVIVTVNGTEIGKL